jgi:signal transduction histidine kinase/CheY-like chemotaxis protein
LVAHPDPSQVLRHLDLRSSPAVQATLGSAPGIATMTRALDGRRILLAVAEVPATHWWVFAEQPVKEAFAPVAAVIRALAFAILVALALAAGLSFLLARRMARPILALRAGAAHLAAGHLDTRIAIATGDEIGLLADEFNHMAAALAHSHAELEQRVEARTLALSDAGVQLQQQSDALAAANAELSRRAAKLALHGDQLERASAAKTRFLAAASHDLLQPMHAVGLLVDILSQHAQPAGSGPLLQKLQGAVRGMEGLFASLLDISRLDAKQVEADIRPVELRQLFAFLEVRYQPLAAAKGLALRVVACDWVVRTDPVLLERILGNLLSNAIRYTTRGGILLGCRRAGPNVRVIVYDTGSGIAPQDQERIYDEFVQLGRSERDRNQGLGLGLAIVHRSAALLGHPLSLRSVVRRGSAFGVRLACLPQQPAAALPGASVPVVPPALKGAFVVLIDDDADSRYAMEQVFGTWSCHVVSAATVAQALTQMENHLRSPDLIVTDWRLPGGADGLDAIASLRKVSEETIPGLLLTADANPPHAAELPARCKVASKPVNVRRMLGLLAELLAPSAPPSV